MEDEYILKRALKDPKINIDFIGYGNYEQIARALPKIPKGAYISEFEHHLYGKLEYECHIHTDGIAKELKTLYAKGIKGGNPWFVGLYSREDLEKLVAEGKAKEKTQKAVNF